MNRGDSIKRRRHHRPPSSIDVNKSSSDLALGNSVTGVQGLRLPQSTAAASTSVTTTTSVAAMTMTGLTSPSVYRQQLVTPDGNVLIVDHSPLSTAAVMTTMLTASTADHGHLDMSSTTSSSSKPPPAAPHPVRVMVMGEEGVGKTALLQQFMTSDFMAAVQTNFGL